MKGSENMPMVWYKSYVNANLRFEACENVFKKHLNHIKSQFNTQMNVLGSLRLVRNDLRTLEEIFKYYDIKLKLDCCNVVQVVDIYNDYIKFKIGIADQNSIRYKRLLQEGCVDEGALRNYYEKNELHSKFAEDLNSTLDKLETDLGKLRFKFNHNSRSDEELKKLHRQCVAYTDQYVLNKDKLQDMGVSINPKVDLGIANDITDMCLYAQKGFAKVFDGIRDINEESLMITDFMKGIEVWDFLNNNSHKRDEEIRKDILTILNSDEEYDEGEQSANILS